MRRAALGATVVLVLVSAEAATSAQDRALPHARHALCGARGDSECLSRLGALWDRSSTDRSRARIVRLAASLLPPESAARWIRISLAYRDDRAARAVAVAASSECAPPTDAATTERVVWRDAQRGVSLAERDGELAWVIERGDHVVRCAVAAAPPSQVSVEAATIDDRMLAIVRRRDEAYGSGGGTWTVVASLWSFAPDGAHRVIDLVESVGEEDFGRCYDGSDRDCGSGSLECARPIGVRGDRIVVERTRRRGAGSLRGDGGRCRELARPARGWPDSWSDPSVALWLEPGAFVLRDGALVRARDAPR